MPRARIQLTMDDADFGYLTENSAKWAGEPDWVPQIAGGRFETVPYGSVPGMAWKHAYWLEEGYAAVMLARTFLDYWGHPYEVIVDTAPGPGWVILTDYDDKAPA